MKSGRLMEGGRLIGGRLIEVGLYQKIPKPEGLLNRSKYRYFLESIAYCNVWITLIFKEAHQHLMD